ncbi:MAG: porin, partial [Acidobacteriota bacterium]
KNSSGSWNRIKPNANWGMGGGGAWEIAGRYSNINLNDGNISGGEMDVFTLALNWYPNPATRLMINYVLSDVDGVGEADFILLRLQFDF